MNASTTTSPERPGAPARPRGRHRRLRWIIGGSIAILVLVVVGAAVAVRLQPTAAPLALPAGVAAPVGPIDGVLHPAAGSLAGFRIPQTVLAMTSDVVGRTSDITGTVTIANTRVTNAAVRVNLLALTSNGRKTAPQFGLSLDTQHYPDATVVLAQPVPLDAAVLSGGVTNVTATVQLTLKGITRSATASLTARRDGANLDVVGSIPVTFADWDIAAPTSYGVFGSLGDHGVAEFLLILQHD
jgi:hypothetical protein